MDAIKIVNRPLMSTNRLKKGLEPNVEILHVLDNIP